MASQYATTRLEWTQNLDVYCKPSYYRKTSIICTIGPRTNSIPMITELIRAGMNIARLNFSHGSHEYHASVIENVRKCNLEHPESPVAIALDTKGPEIRTGKMLHDKEIEIPEGHEMILSTNERYADIGSLEVVYVDYKSLPESTEIGRFIYVDDGQLRFRVTEVHKEHVKVKAMNRWKISNNKGVNLPMTSVNLPALSERDKKDLTFGVEQRVDIVFASFIRKQSDILEIRQHLGDAAKDIKIIAKIESHEGVNNFDSILEVADGVMVARGDLGLEIPVEKVFIAQKKMIARCNTLGKPVICATQMLETMTYNPRPTRAEVSDVANAVLDGADCVMLSGETAKGEYPIETVIMMHKLCREAEEIILNPPLFDELLSITPKPTSMTEAIASSAVNACMEQKAKAIIVLTTTGNSARLVAKYRPRVPILTVTRFSRVARQCHLYRSCYPMHYKKESAVDTSRPGSPIMMDQWQEDVDSRITWAMEEGKKRGMLEVGDTVVAIQGWRGGAGFTSVMRIMVVPQ